MIRSLLGALVRRHGLAFASSALAMSALGPIMRAAAKSEGLGVPAATRLGLALLILLPALAMFVGVRLFGRDLSHGTWSFMRMLPASHGLQMAITAAFGWVWTTSGTLCAYLGASMADVSGEVFVANIGRVLAASTFWWSFGLWMGAVGRYRWGAASATIVAIMTATVFNVKIWQFAPVGLVLDIGLSSRDWMGPASTAALLGAGMTIAGCVVMSVRDGMVVRRLAEPMLRGQQFVLATMLILALHVPLTARDRTSYVPPHDDGARRLGNEPIVVYVVGGDDTHEALGARVLADLAGLAADLRLESLVPVTIELATAHHTQAIESIHQGDAASVRIRYNPSAPEFDEHALRAEVLGGVLERQSNTVLQTEAYRWLASGYANQRAFRDAEERGATNLRAAAAVRDAQATFHTVRNASRTSDLLDGASAQALHELAFNVLVDMVSEDRVLEEIRRWTSPPIARGAIGSAQYLWRAPAAAFERMGLSENDFDERLRHRFTKLQEEHHHALNTLPALRAIVVTEDIGGDVRRVRIRLEDGGSLSDDTRVRLHWWVLGPLDWQLEQSKTFIGVSAARAREGVAIPDAHRAGGRLAVAFYVYEPRLRGARRSAIVRAVLP